MTEHTRDFERRAFGAAGPVFLVAMGSLLLSLLAFLALLRAVPPGVGAAFGAAGGIALVVGLLWGSSQKPRRAERPRLIRGST